MIRCKIHNNLSFRTAFDENNFIIFYMIFSVLDSLIEEICVFLRRVSLRGTKT